MLEVHPKPARLEVETAANSSDFQTGFVASRRLRVEHAFILGETEVERGWLEGIAVIREDTQVIHIPFPDSENRAERAAQSGVCHFRPLTTALCGCIQPQAAVHAESWDRTPLRRSVSAEESAITSGILVERGWFGDNCLRRSIQRSCVGKGRAVSFTAGNQRIATSEESELRPGLPDEMGISVEIVDFNVLTRSRRIVRRVGDIHQETTK